MVSDGDDAATLDLQGLEQATDMARIDPAVVRADHRGAGRAPGRRALEGMSKHRLPAGPRRPRPSRSVSDCSSSPRSSIMVRCRESSPLGRTRSTAGARRGGQLVVSELSCQVVGPRPILPVLPERDPDFFLLHQRKRLQVERLRARSLQPRIRIPRITSNAKDDGPRNDPRAGDRADGLIQDLRGTLGV